jgi:hypothetical protein
MKRATLGTIGFSVTILWSAAFAQPAADKCGSIYFFQQARLFSPYNRTVAEVYSSEAPGQDFELRGMVMMGDWGAIKTCATKIDLRVDWLLDGSSVSRWARAMDARRVTVDRTDARPVYVQLSSKGDWGVVEERIGVEAMAAIGETGAAFLAKWDFELDRYCWVCDHCKNGARPQSRPRALAPSCIEQLSR